MIKRSIGKKAIWFVVVAASAMTICLLVIGFAGVWRMRFSTIGQWKKADAQIFSIFISQQIDKKVEGIKAYLSNQRWTDAIKENNLHYLGWEPEAIKEYMVRKDAHWVAEPDSQFIRELLGSRISQRLKALKEQTADIAEIFLTDQYGGLVASSNKTSDFYQADEDWWQHAYNNGKGGVCVSDIGLDESSGKISIALSIPIKDKTGHIIGISKTVLDTAIFFQPLKEYKLGKTGHVGLFDNYGKVIYYPSLKPMSKSVFSSIELDRLSRTKNGFAIIKPGSSREKLFVATNKVNNTLLEEYEIDWIVAVIQSEKEVFLPLYAIFGVNLILALGVSSFTVLIIRNIVRRDLIIPLQKFRDGVWHFSGGETDYKLDLKTGDEIEDLADAFNEMAARLRATTVSRDYISGVMGSMADTLIVVDRESKITDVNEAICRLLGYEKKELIGKDATILFLEEKDPLNGTKLKKFLKGEILGNYEINYKTKDGEGIPIILTRTILKGIDCPKGIQREDCPSFKEKGEHCKKIRGAVYVAKDITERKNAEEQLRQGLKEQMRSRRAFISMLDDNNQIRQKLEKKIKDLKISQDALIQSEKMASLGRLISDISHEVNNPLMIISSHAQLSLMSGAVSGEQKEALELIVRECKRAADIMHRILKFAKPSKGEMKDVDICGSIDAVVDILEKQFNMSKVEIKRNYPGQPVIISVDNQLMQEVFMNILNNAKEAMPDGGTVTITGFLKGNFFVIDFKDTGCGISEETKRKVSEPFFTTKEKGTGLGLSICYGIIKAHNGDMNFESQLNKGSTVTVLLPLGKRRG